MGPQAPQAATDETTHVRAGGACTGSGGDLPIIQSLASSSNATMHARYVGTAGGDAQFYPEGLDASMHGCWTPATRDEPAAMLTRANFAPPLFDENGQGFCRSQRVRHGEVETAASGGRPAVHDSGDAARACRRSAWHSTMRPCMRRSELAAAGGAFSRRMRRSRA